MFFDVRAAKLLKPGEHLAVEGCEGRRLVASESKQTWTYRYKAPATGLMKQTAIGTYPKMRASEAAAAWETLRAKRAQGIDPEEYMRQQRKPLPAAPVASAVPTVRDVVMDYITNHLEQERKEAGAKAARRALERLLEEEPGFAETPANDVTRSTCFDLLDARKATATTFACYLAGVTAGAADLSLAAAD